MPVEGIPGQRNGLNERYGSAASPGLHASEALLACRKGVESGRSLRLLTVRAGDRPLDRNHRRHEYSRQEPQ